MNRKIASVLAGAAIVGTVFAAPGVASAATLPGGVYPNNASCALAGDLGVYEGRWVGYYCQLLNTYGDYELWVYITGAANSSAAARVGLAPVAGK